MPVLIGATGKPRFESKSKFTTIDSYIGHVSHARIGHILYMSRRSLDLVGRCATRRMIVGDVELKQTKREEVDKWFSPLDTSSVLFVEQRWWSSSQPTPTSPASLR